MAVYRPILAARLKGRRDVSVGGRTLGRAPRIVPLPSGGGPASVDHEGLARDVGRVLAGEVDRGGGDLRQGASATSRRDGANGLLARAHSAQHGGRVRAEDARRIRPETGLDRPGTDRVDRDALLRIGDGELP